MKSEPREWSAPDAHGVRTCYLDVGAMSTLRGRRLRRRDEPDIYACRIWPEQWRALLRDWLKTDGERRKWSSLLKAAGHDRVASARNVLEGLLNAGWTEVEERREAGHWQPVWMRFLALDRLRVQMGMPDRGQRAAEWEALAQRLLTDARLGLARQSLNDLTPGRAGRRMKLLLRLDEWLTARRSGTRRDFAFAATGDTKGIYSADWEWLEDHLDLPSLGIQQHTPALWLRAPLILRGNNNRALDLRLITDCVAISPSTLDGVTGVDGHIDAWRVIENRTTFERVARSHGERDAVVWLPGFPPGWWLSTMDRLVERRPAPGMIACDPDPAGIHIALRAGTVWERRGMTWTPWLMGAADLADLGQRKALTSADRALLTQLDLVCLPLSLQRLAAWMIEHQEKGEQEGVSFDISHD